MNWYNNKFRRHLCDMHIDDWDESFLSEFSADEYFENLKRANVQSAMIYLQSHIGVCHYPTKSGKMHNAFVGRENEMRKLFDLCHANNIDVIGYYSLVFNTWAAKEHPDWQMVNVMDGKTSLETGSRYGHCCPNNPEYRKFVFDQIAEMIEYAPMEGLFYDMPFWPYYCGCDHCKKRWFEETGYEFPKPAGEHWRLFEIKSREWMGEFSLDVTAETKRLLPSASVEQNYAHSALPLGCIISHLTNDACDYIGGDLYGDFASQSFACKYFRGASHNQPFEYMTSRCNPDLLNHTVTKSDNRLLTGIMLTCAHHGATLMIDAIDPVGTLNDRFYSKLGELYKKEEVYEPYLTGEMIEDVGIFCHYGAKMNLQGQQSCNNHSGSVNTARTLAEEHIPHGIIASENIKNLEKYKFIMLSNPNRLTDAMVDMLIDYVEKGGTLYFSNTDEQRLLHTLVGAELKSYTEHDRTYIAAKDEYLELLGCYGKKYPLPFDYKLPIVEGIEDKYVLAKIVLPYTLPNEQKCASIHSNPPGIITDIPALAVKPYGKGTVIWSAVPIENVPIIDYKKIICRLITQYANGEISVSTNASPIIELISFKDGDTVRVSAVNLNDNDVNIPQPEFNVILKGFANAKGVTLLPSGEKVPFTNQNGCISFKACSVNIFDMYEIKLGD